MNRNEQKRKLDSLIKSGNSIRGVDTPTHDFIETSQVSPEMMEDHLKLMKEYNPNYNLGQTQDFLSESEKNKEFHEIVHDLISYIEVGYNELQTEKLRGVLMEKYNHTSITRDFTDSKYKHEGLHDASWYRKEINRLRQIQSWLEQAYKADPNIISLYDNWYLYRVHSEETIKNYESRLQMLTRSENQPTTAKFDMVEDMDVNDMNTDDKIKAFLNSFPQFAKKNPTTDMTGYTPIGYKMVYEDKNGDRYMEE